MEADERALERRLRHEMDLKRLDAETQLKMLEIELRNKKSVPDAAWTSSQEPDDSSASRAGFRPDPVTPASSPLQTTPFDVSKCITLLPQFRETEVDGYFLAFERIAATLQWPREVWPLLLTCRLTGKALQVVSALSPTDGASYDKVKSAVLTAYELVPEAYRQRFRFEKPKLNQSYVEYAHLKSVIFEKWCTASHVSSFAELKELILIEEFKRHLPERLVLYLNEQKVNSFSEAALLADEFSLTHRVREIRTKANREFRPSVRISPNSAPEKPECFYCHKRGHVIRDCYSLKLKNRRTGSSPNKDRTEIACCDKTNAEQPNLCFKPFLSEGFVSLPGSEDDTKVVILRDTGASLTLIKRSLLPFSENSQAGYSVMLQDDNSVTDTTAVTKPQIAVNFPISYDALVAAQKMDKTLQPYFSLAAGDAKPSIGKASYIIENEVLLRCWDRPSAEGAEWGKTKQIVMPEKFRSPILELAHECEWSGHLGINKTYDAILRHFFWPGLKKDVSGFCKSCPTCQKVGNPNQTIRPAPLHPTPVISTPFDHIVIDCVGPLPPSRTGKKYLLTIICSATRFPEAVPLSSVTTANVIKALTGFFSVFGLPKIIQSDQGTNFTSRIFAQVAKTLKIQHLKSSSYHPESQGVVERWHQTLKSMLRKYCLSTGRSWEDGLPFVLFAARDAVQESTGFSPHQLVFGHTPRGPLKVLREKFLWPVPQTGTNVPLYVETFKKRLREANLFAQQHLEDAKLKMKRIFDRKAVPRTFQPGDQVLLLSPIVGSSLAPKFKGPFVIHSKLNECNYVIKTPLMRKKTMVCHINRLKLFCVRNPVIQPCLASTEVAPQKSEVSADDPVPWSPTPPITPRLCNSEALANLTSSLGHLASSQQKELSLLIHFLPKLFSDVPSQTPLITHDITLTDSVPVRLHPYRASPLKRDLMKAEVNYLLEHGLAKTSSSSWSSPCLLENKPDGTYRFVTDYRKLNAKTVPDSFPLPRVEDCVDSVGSATFVTKLDLLKGYWQVPLTPFASKVSAFVTPDNLLQYTVLPFGLRNAPATFQRLVNQVLSDIPHCSAYLDDIVVYTNSWDLHIQILERVFDRLKFANLTLNLAKCEFVRATVRYLGKDVGQGQVRALADKIQAIVSFPPPTTRRELRRFLGMTGYYRCFCRNFSTVAKPLTDMLSTNIPFSWTPDCHQAFLSLRNLLCCAPILAAPDLSRPFKIEVDASDAGAGAVLLQQDANGLDHPVSYFSRKFNQSQRNYSTIEKETLALIWSLQHFHVYVCSQFTTVVFSDHNPLTFLHRMFNANQRLMRWALLLQEFDIKVRHKKGTDNMMADALSRCHTD
uniref:Gypsy retrotransposon integrase-like protein 1 n=1 Tax=Nothobranchius kuhntae TaxID=321403 RepID=A0A1A8I1B8_NOTKU